MPTKPDNILGSFIVGRLLAENVGLSSSEATQWGAVLMALGLSPASILLVTELARVDAMRSSEQLNQEAQLRNTIQQTFEKAQEAAENAAHAAAGVEQVIAKLDELDDRMTRLEAWADNQSCTRKTCEESLMNLHELRDDNFFKINILKHLRRRTRYRRNPFRSWCHFFTRIWS